MTRRALRYHGFKFLRLQVGNYLIPFTQSKAMPREAEVSCELRSYERPKADLKAQLLRLLYHVYSPEQECCVRSLSEQP